MVPWGVRKWGEEPLAPCVSGLMEAFSAKPGQGCPYLGGSEMETGPPSHKRQTEGFSLGPPALPSEVKVGSCRRPQGGTLRSLSPASRRPFSNRWTLGLPRGLPVPHWPRGLVVIGTGWAGGLLACLWTLGTG